MYAFVLKDICIFLSRCGYVGLHGYCIFSFGLQMSVKRPFLKRKGKKCCLEEIKYFILGLKCFYLCVSLPNVEKKKKPGREKSGEV